MWQLRRSLPILLVISTGCSFDPAATVSTASDDDGGTRADATFGSVDAPGQLPDAVPMPPDARPGTDAALPDAGCAQTSLPFAPTNFSRCELPTPGGAFVVPTGRDWQLNTTSGALTTLNGGDTPPTLSTAIITQPSEAPELLLVAMSSLTIEQGASLTLLGARTVAFSAEGDMVIDGVIYAGATYERNGPGTDGGTACTDARGANGGVQTIWDGSSAGTGGGGGGFGGTGGTGAKVDGSDGEPTAGGGTTGNAAITPLRGGCRGGNGGGDGGGLRGRGGGGLQLVAGGTINVGANGAIAAPGSGGVGTTAGYSGGGGGGSGGAILLEAWSIGVVGAITANGGAGAEGARGSAETQPGEIGHVFDANPAAGSSGGSSGGDGGDGGAGSHDAQDGAEGTSGTLRPAAGGGGGGAAGRIRLTTYSGQPVISGVVSPQAQ